MISWLFYVFSFCSFCNGFLLDTNTQGLSGNLLNKDRYDALLKLFMDERKARCKLQNYVIKQQQKMDTLGNLPDRMEKVENLMDKISNLENSTAYIDEKYSKLERKCKSLQHKQNQLESRLKAAENRTLQLEKELSSLKQVKAVNQRQNIANLQQQMQTVQNNVNSLIVTSQARGQDTISMYKDLTVNKQKIVMFENDQQQMNINISVIEQTFKDNMTLIESSVNALDNHNLVVNSTLEDIIKHNRHVNSSWTKLILRFCANSQARGQDMTSMYKDLTLNKQKLTNLEDGHKKLTVNISILGATLNDNLKVFEMNVYQNLTQTIGSALENQNLMINSTLEEIIERDIHVGFTAFGRGMGHRQPAHILKFPDIKSSFGLTSISNFTRSGEFTCERRGIYLISVTVMACADGAAKYDIYKNKISLMQYYVTLNNCNSGSGTLLIRLNVNDMVYVETHSSINYVYYKWSSLSILKVA